MNYYKPYSRLAKIEEQKNKRTAIKYIVLTIVFIVFVLIFGMKMLPKIAGILVDINPEAVTTETDTTPPGPPSISSLPEATSQNEITVSGFSEPGSNISLLINDDKKEMVADTNGEFTTTIKLIKGENTLFAKAIDSAGNESVSSAHFTVIFDNEKPKIEITKPKDGDKFYGSKQKQITIEGITDPECRVTINDRFVVIDSTGGFHFLQTLGDGENSFNIKSTDKAGNQTELTIYVTYYP